MLRTYHLSRLCTCNAEFKVGIFFPVSEEQREFGKKAIVGLAGSGYSLRTRVAIEAAFLRLGGAYELFPILKLFWFFELPHKYQ